MSLGRPQEVHELEDDAVRVLGAEDLHHRSAERDVGRRGALARVELGKLN